MDNTDQPSPVEPGTPLRRAGRFWLYLPFGLLCLVALCWSVLWLVMQGRVQAMMERWLVSEQGRGRIWTCQDQVIRGFPFRLELSCQTLTLASPDISLETGPIIAVAQILSPRHVIFETQNPVTLKQSGGHLQGSWQSMQGSIRFKKPGLERFSLFLRESKLAFDDGERSLALAGQSLEGHIRAHMGEEDAFDLLLKGTGLTSADLDLLAGESSPAALEWQAKITPFPLGPLTLKDRLAGWQDKKGKLDIILLSLRKGPGLLEAKGDMRLDNERRPAGLLHLRAEGWQGKFAKFNAAGNLLTALAGGKETKTLPLRLSGGQVFLGPLLLPLPRLEPLY
jgi:hypothetical protein